MEEKGKKRTSCEIRGEGRKREKERTMRKVLLIGRREYQEKTTDLFPWQKKEKIVCPFERRNGLEPEVLHRL